MKVLLAGAAAGVAMFVWGAVSHMVLPLGDVGLTPLPDDNGAIAAVLKEKVTQPGLYMYPWETDMAKLEALYRERPRGLITYTPAGVPFNLGAGLGTQFLLDVLAGISLAFLMKMALAALPSRGSRILFAAAAGTIGTLFTLTAFWNWYGFPLSFVAATVADTLVACAIAGFILSRTVR